MLMQAIAMPVVLIIVATALTIYVQYTLRLKIEKFDSSWVNIAYITIMVSIIYMLLHPILANYQQIFNLLPKWDNA